MWSHTGISFDTYKDHQNGPRHEDRVLPIASLLPLDPKSTHISPKGSLAFIQPSATTAVFDR